MIQQALITTDIHALPTMRPVTPNLVASGVRARALAGLTLAGCFLRGKRDQPHRSNWRGFLCLLPRVALRFYFLLLILQLPCMKSFNGSKRIKTLRSHLLSSAPGHAGLHRPQISYREASQPPKPCNFTPLHFSLAFTVGQLNSFVFTGQITSCLVSGIPTVTTNPGLLCASPDKQ